MNGRENTRVWPYVLAIFLFPAIVLWRQDNSLFTPPGHIDAWVYLGFFRSLVNFKRDLFPQTYYGSRLSWVLPGALAQTLFSPIAATAILNLIVFWTAAISLFTTLRLTVGIRPAFLTTLIFSINPQIWYAIGTGYVDGAAIAYCLLAMALFTLAAFRPEESRILVLAGAAVAALLYDTLFWAALIPLLVLHYAGTLWSLGRFTARKTLRDLVQKAGFGFLLVTVALCAINYSLDGVFWFYGPSLRAVSGTVSSNLWAQNPWTTYGLGPWLWLTTAAAIVGAVSIALRLKDLDRGARFVVTVSLELLFAASLLAYMQFRLKLTVLGLPYYSSCLLPFVFLVIGAAFWRSAELLKTKTWRLACSAAVLTAAFIWGEFPFQYPSWPTAVLPMAVTGITLLAAGLLLSHRSVGTWAILAGLACFTAETRFLPASQLETNSPATPPSSTHAYRNNLRRLMVARDSIEELRRNRPVRFWYDDREPPREDYVALNATYLYLFTRFVTPFPNLSCDNAIPAESLIVVTTQKQHAAELAMASLQPCITHAGLVASAVSTTNTDSPAGRYVSVLLSISRDPARWHVLQTTGAAEPPNVRLAPYSAGRESLPLLRWNILYPELGTSIHPVRDGLALKTGVKAHTDAAIYGPMVAPASGRYEFVLYIQPGSGKIAFGVVSSNSWLAADITGHAGSDKEMKCSLDLQRGQTIDLRLSNNNEHNSPASLTITGLTAVEIDPL